MLTISVAYGCSGTLAPAVIRNAPRRSNLTRNLCGAFSLAMINTIVIDRGATHRLHLAEAGRTGSSTAVAALENMQVAVADRSANGASPELVALRRLSQMVAREGTVLAHNDALLVMAGFFIAALPLVLLLRAPKALPAEAGAH